ncbi:MAG: hemerythrin domain-containing protein [Candidatus Aminicenantales bacterium]
MQARGLLMTEHRLIEKMIGAIQRALGRTAQTQSIDPSFIDTVVDFFQVYADRTHHGKEEDVLFRDLRKKGLSPEDGRLMKELIEDHVLGRQTIKALAEANMRYRKGEGKALPEMTARLRALVDLYPKHIDKEDKIFFPAALTYLSTEEDRAMLAEFWEFDKKMIHDRYRAVVQGLEGN